MNGLKGAIDAQGALACSSSDGLCEDVQAFANYSYRPYALKCLGNQGR
jgi:hypothetical protein